MLSLNLTLALERAVHDMSGGRTFLIPPYTVGLVEYDSRKWLDELRSSIEEGRFQPSPQRNVDMPKANGTIRPGCVLTLEDHVVLCALVSSVDSIIRSAVEWGDPIPDFAYRFHTDREHPEWFQSYFPLWKAFHRRSIEYLDTGFEYVVEVDIAGYYEQIDLNILRSDLNALGVDHEALELLMKCLHRWSDTQRRGIPQGHAAADILGKLYLNSVDRSLSDMGYTHIRWVDDYRIFARTRAEARRALLDLVRLLRTRGLVVQSAKTGILTAADARPRYNAIESVIHPIREEAVSRLRASLELAEISLTNFQIDELLGQAVDKDPVSIFEEAYRVHVVEQHTLNKTLFRYFLKRLANGGSEFALEHALLQLRERPEETAAVLGYATKLGTVERAEAAALEYLESEEAIYQHQWYQILRWRAGIDTAPSDEFLNLARRALFELKSTWYVRGIARVILARWGRDTDLERIMLSYRDAESDTEAAEIICALQRLERSRRNAFLGHAQGDGELQARAARAVRGGRVEWE